MSLENYIREHRTVQEAVDRDAWAAWRNFNAELKRIGDRGVAQLVASAAKNGVKLNGRPSYYIQLGGGPPSNITIVAVSLRDDRWDTW